MLIVCPFCGPRELDEFAYAGDGTRTRPDEDAGADAWFVYVYLRANPRGPHLELWQHVQGCRRYLRVRRDTVTHEITEVRPASGEAP